MTLQEKDKAYIWHPFTPIKGSDTPILIEKAKGCTLYAADGKTYIDAIASWWVNIHGHANAYIANAIAQQAMTLEHVIFAGFTHPQAINLTERLIHNLPPQSTQSVMKRNASYSKVFFSDDGSTSVEVALKMALQYWFNKGVRHKTTIIAFENAYHGDTFGSMSVGGRNTFSAPFDPLLFEVVHIQIPTDNNFEALKMQFDHLVKNEKTAAFIFEPLVQGAAGMHMYKAEHLDQLIEIAQKNNVVCIADEVMTGFGRTGKLFATNYCSHVPDIFCLSKGITGGFMALGVTICSHTIYETFISDDISKTFFHGHSYTANPLACAAANASLDILLGEECQQNIQNICLSHTTFVEKIEGNARLRNVRQTGTILAIEFKTVENSSYFNSFKEKAYKFYLENGVLLRPLGNVIYIMPPYCITTEELEFVYSVILKSIDVL